MGHKLDALEGNLEVTVVIDTCEPTTYCFGLILQEPFPKVVRL